MNKVMKVFSEENLGTIRTVVIEGEPWFINIDACKCLGIKNPSDAFGRLDNDEKKYLPLGSTEGKTRKFSLVNESGLYALILSSRKKEARKFQKWITSIVLPSIRRNGGYILGQENLPEDKKEELVHKIQTLRSSINNEVNHWIKMYESLLNDYLKVVEKKAPSLPEREESRYVVLADGTICDKKLLNNPYER